MVANRFVEAMRARDVDGRFHVTVLADEPRPPYDRVALTSYFSGRDPRELNPGTDDLWKQPQVKLRMRALVTGVDRMAGTVTLSTGEAIGYDHLVLATGSSPVRAAGQGQRSGGLVRVPHDRRRRGVARLRRDLARQPGPASSAVPSAGGGPARPSRSPHATWRSSASTPLSCTGRAA